MTASPTSSDRAFGRVSDKASGRAFGKVSDAGAPSDDDPFGDDPCVRPFDAASGAGEPSDGPFGELSGELSERLASEPAFELPSFGRASERPFSAAPASAERASERLFEQPLSFAAAWERPGPKPDRSHPAQTNHKLLLSGHVA